MSSYHRPGRGCPCEVCEKKRAYNRQRYAEKYKGVPRNRADSRPMKPAENGALVRGREPRFVLSEGRETSVVHWMPKEGGSWNCPKCDNAFMNSDGTWTACA